VTVTAVRPGLVRWLYARRGWLWLVPAAAAAVLTLLITVVLPPDRTQDNVAEWTFALSPLVLAVLAVSVLPRGRFGPLVIVLAVLAYMAYVDTTLILRVLEFRATGRFGPLYQFQLIVVGYLVLAGLLGLRLGGARSAVVLKTGVAAILVVVSGLNDVTFWAMYRFPEGRPDTLHWASHIAVFTGGPPGVATAVVFAAVHLVLAGIVLALPAGRWVDRALCRPR
jgi:hypothetical protein